MKLHLYCLFWLQNVTHNSAIFRVWSATQTWIQSHLDFLSLLIEPFAKKRPQNASLLPLLLSQTACFHVLQPCWKTEKELTHEGSSRNSAPQSMTTKHSLTLKGESADLFLLAMRSLFFKLKFICDPDQRACHTWRFSVLWDMSWPLITRASMEQQFCRSHGKIQVYTVGPLSKNPWGSDEISNQWKTDKRR